MKNQFNNKNKIFFKKNGYVILENILSKKKIFEIKNKIYQIYENEKKSKILYNYTFDKSQRTKRIWNLVNKSKIFRNLIQNKVVNNYMEWIFDRKTNHQKYFLSSFQANILQDGALAQKLHVDTPVPEPLPSWPLKANSIWMLDNFTEENGATEVLPGSHKFRFKPKKKDNKNKKIIKCVGNAGSVIITHGALWHRAGSNNSSNDRLALLGSFAASYAKEIASEEDQSLIIDNFTLKKSSSFLKKILGVGQGIKKGALHLPRHRD